MGQLATAVRDNYHELVDIAAASEHPEPLWRYAAAAGKRLAALECSVEFEQAVILAGIMSRRLADQIWPLAHLRWPAVLRELAKRLGDACPGGAGSDPVREGRRRLPEEMVSPPRPATERSSASAAIGWTPSRASLWVAALRLLGLTADEVFQARVAGSSDRVRVRVDGQALWLGAETAGRPEKQASHGPTRPGLHGGARLFNDAVVLPFRQRGHRAQPNRHRRPGLRFTAEAAPTPALALDPSSCTGPDELAFRARRWVLTQSAERPRSVYTLALYAHQTLLVHRVEAYALASASSSAVARLARRLPSLEELLGWMRRSIRNGSIFGEPDRLMLPHQVAAHRLGRPLDRALLLFGVLHRLGAGARVIQTTQGAYVLVRDHRGVRLVDAARLRVVDSPAGVVTLAFDAHRQYGLREAWEPPEGVVAAAPAEFVSLTVA